MKRFPAHIQWLVLLVLVTVLGAMLVISHSIAVAQGTTPPTPVPTIAIPQGTNNSLQISKTMWPATLIPGQDATVSIQVRGLRLSQCAGSPVRPVDAILAIDNSVSAGQGPGSNLEQTITRAINFVDNLQQPIYTYRDSQPAQSRVGLIAHSADLSNTLPILVQPLTDQVDVVRDAISQLTSGGDVDAVQIIRMATNQLSSRDSRRAGVILLMLHDRIPLQQSMAVEQAIQDARQFGIKVYVFVNNINVPSQDRVSSTDLDTILQLQSSQPLDYWFDPSVDNVRDAFVRAADGTMDLAARDILLVDQFLDPSVAVILDVGEGGYVENDRVIWKLHHLRAGDEIKLSYRFYVRPETVPGSYTMHTSGAFLDCNGYLIDQPAGDPARTPLLEYQASVALPTPTPFVTLSSGEAIPLFTPTPVSVFTQTHPFLEAEHMVDPPSGLFRRDEYAVTITLLGTGEKCPPTVRRYPVDALLVLDRSGSMAWGFGSTIKLDEAKRAAVAFVDELTRSSNQSFPDRVGVVAFDSSGQLVHELSENSGSLRQAIQTIDLGGGTDIAEALRAAYEILQQDHRAGVSQLIVLLSDGGSNYGAAIDMARTIKDADVRIVTVGLGYDTDDRLMRDVASELPDYHFADPGTSLEDMFRNIAISARRAVPATNIRVIHTYDSERFEIIPDSIDPPATTDQPGKIIWEVDQVDPANTTLVYHIRAKVHGLRPVLNDAQVVFTSCEARDELITMQEGDKLEADTLLPSKSVTMTLPVTLSVQIKAPAYGMASSPEIDQWRIRLCNWKLVWPLLALLLLLLFFLIWFFALGGKHFIKNLQNRTWCTLFKGLLLLWMITFLIVLAYSLSAGVCVDQRTLIFWRIQGQESKLYFARPSLNRRVEPFEVDRYEQGNVGGYSVSPSSKLLAIASQGGHAWPGEFTIQRIDQASGIVAGLRGTYFAWSPNGHKLAYSHEDRDIYILDLDTQTYTPLPGASEPGIIETMPAWSPDGSTIAFVRPRDPTSDGFAISGLSDIYVVPAEGGQAALLQGASEGGLNYYPHYSPNGRWLLFTSAPEGSSYSNPQAKIFVLPAAGGKAIPIRANNSADGKHIENASNTWAVWSADGTQIYFNSKRGGNYDTYVADFVEEQEETADGIVYHPDTGPAIPITEANTAHLEHQAYYVDPARPITIWQMLGWAWQALCRFWPLLPLLLLLVLLGWLYCREIISDPPPIPRGHRDAGEKLEAWEGPAALWQPAPALVIGLGGTGRRVLTYLKKNLLDSGAGKFPPQVKFLLIDTDEQDAPDVGYATDFTGVHLDPETDGVFLMQQDLDQLIEQMRYQPVSEPEMKDWFPFGAYQTLTQAQRQLATGSRRRRPLARAGLFREMQLGHEKPGGLWHRLFGQSQAAQDEKQHLRVLVVGSLAGGLGSGILADVAYLARRAGGMGKARQVIVEAYLATDKAFAALMDDQTTSATNTFAALRELDRLQMCGDQPYPFRYRHAPGDDLLDGRCNRRLLDEVYLFDGGQLMGAPPTQWLYPAMADAMTLMLDPVSREGGALHNHRQQTQGNAVVEQRATGHAVFSGLGSFQVRLPLPDMIEALALRWAEDLVVKFLTGKVQKQEHVQKKKPIQEQITLRIDQNQEAGDALKVRVSKFLTERYAYGDTPIPGPIDSGCLRLLAGDKILVSDLQKRLKRLGLHDVKTEQRAFSHYLNAALLYILNGDSASPPLTARAGKIAYSLEFLSQLEEELQRVEGKAKGISGLNKKSQDRLAQICQVLPAYVEQVAETRKNLVNVRDLLVLPDRPTPQQEKLGSVVKQLDDRETRLVQWRKAMGEILTRHYLGYEMQGGKPDNATLDDWYDLYLESQLDAHLDRLFWQEMPDGQVRLALHAWEDVVLRSEPEGIAHFSNALLEMARYVAREIWEKEQAALANLLKQAITQVHGGSKFVDRLWDGSAQLLNCDLGKATQSTLHTALAGTPAALAAGNVQGQLKKHVPPAWLLTALNMLNPCTLAVLRMLDLAPFWAADAVRDAYAIYQSQKGLLGGNEQTAVFAAEENARRLEVRLDKIKREPHPFHPMVVAGLERMEHARVYALAYAAGYVILNPHTRQVRLSLPGCPEQPLTEEVAPGVQLWLHPLVKAMMVFGELPDEQVARVAAILAQPSDEVLARWKMWEEEEKGIPKNDILARDGQPEARDLGEVTALVVRDRLARM